ANVCWRRVWSRLTSRPQGGQSALFRIRPVSLSEPSVLSDPQLGGLMAAAQDGDRAAYDRLLRESVPMIRRIARYRGSPPASIDDIVQDVLLTIHRVRHTFDPA